MEPHNPSNNEEKADTNPPSAQIKRVRIDFSDVGGHEEWIEVESDRLAIAGRYTLDSIKNLDDTDAPPPPTPATIGTPSVTGEFKKLQYAAAGRKIGSQDGPSSSSADLTHNVNSGQVCPFPGYGACGLTNLGNTCYANAALQCISYMPLLRCYILSGLYKADLNRDNPLGTGGKLLEEYADLLRILWSGKYSSRAPTKFRTQLGKARSQFSSNDQQDAQELLNYMLDALHEDSSKIKKKPLVPPLEDAWVKNTGLPRVGLEAWRRYLRRNRSIIANVAMGQVLNRVTCPVCNHTSLNFDPFDMLSIPFPTVADVNIRCTVVRRATALNCSQTQAKQKKYSQSDFSKQASFDGSNGSDISPPSCHLIVEQYIVSISRLADIGDLKMRLQRLTGISATRLKLSKAEEIIVNPNLTKNNPLRTYCSVTALPDKQGPVSQLAKQPLTSDNISTPVIAPIQIVAFESTLKTRPPPFVEDDEADITEEDGSSQDEIIPPLTNNTPKTTTSIPATPSERPPTCPENTAKRQRALEKQLQVYGDNQECHAFDTDPTPFSRAMSRSLWPKTPNDFKLGLRVDAIDHRNHWYPGSVVEIIETNPDAERAANRTPPASGEDNPPATRVRIHFDNFSSKWDEVYSIEHFQQGQVRPLYSHATPRVKPLEFLVHHRHSIQLKKSLAVHNANGTPTCVSLFGQSFYLQCHNEWSTARAGAHILAQAARFLQSAPILKLGHPDLTSSSDETPPQSKPDDVTDITTARSEDSLSSKAMEDSRLVIAEVIRVLIDIDRKYVKAALSLNNQQEDTNRTGRKSSSFNASSMTMSLSRKLSSLLPRLPFEVRVCAADSPLGGHANKPSDEVAYPFSLVRTIGNYMNARHAIVLHWHGWNADSSSSPVQRKHRSSSASSVQSAHSTTDSCFLLYAPPALRIHKQSRTMLDNTSNAGKTNQTDGSASLQRHNSGVHGGMHLSVCLTEFCKEQQLPEGWKCPKCKVDREGRQSMTLWHLPDLLTFHIKRFNCSARWREKISTKVNFPLTGLDMRQWCDPESPSLSGPNDSTVYDLIGVINHLGGMTGGHYVAVCKATHCGSDGSEEVAHSFNGAGVCRYETEEESAPSGWRLSRNKEKDLFSVQSRTSTAIAKSVSQSSEPLWLQFDDDLVEPIPPKAVVSDGAYVLFYRRRRLTPANIARYNIPE